MEGRYAISNRIPPSLKTTLRFRKLNDECEIFGRVVQCRTGHAYTGEFRRQFAPGEPTICPCDNESFETCEHIIIHCGRYEAHRDILREAYPHTPNSLPEPQTGLMHCEFLRKSGTFSRTDALLKLQPQPLFENEPTPSTDNSGDEAFEMRDKVNHSSAMAHTTHFSFLFCVAFSFSFSFSFIMIL